MENITFGTADIPLSSAKYDGEKARAQLVKDTSAKDTAQLRKEVSEKHQRARELMEKAKPEDKGSGYRLSALKDEGIGSTEGEIADSIQAMNDEIAMNRAMLRERDYARQVFSRVADRDGEDEAEAQALEGATANGQLRASLRGQNLNTITGLMAASSPKFRDMIADGKLLDGGSIGFGDNDLTLSDIINCRAQNVFQRPTTAQTTEGWAPEVLRSGRVQLDTAVTAPALMDILPTVPMAGGGYKFMREATVANAATTEAETDEFAAQALRVNEVTVNAQKVAVYLLMTDEQLADVPGAAAYINNRLPYLVRSQVDSQIWNGNGTAPNWTGFDAQSIPADVEVTSSTGNVFDVINTQIGDIEKNQPAGSADFIAVSRADLSKLQQKKIGSTDNRYLMGGPNQMAAPMLWGVPIVVSNAITADHALIGISRDCAVGQQGGVELAYGYTDKDFIKGQQAVRCTVRGNLIVYNLNSFRIVGNLDAS